METSSNRQHRQKKSQRSQRTRSSSTWEIGDLVRIQERRPICDWQRYRTTWPCDGCKDPWLGKTGTIIAILGQYCGGEDYAEGIDLKVQFDTGILYPTPDIWTFREEWCTKV